MFPMSSIRGGIWYAPRVRFPSIRCWVKTNHLFTCIVGYVSKLYTFIFFKSSRKRQIWRENISRQKSKIADSPGKWPFGFFYKILAKNLKYSDRREIAKIKAENPSQSFPPTFYFFSFSSGITGKMCNSCNCFASTGQGACVIKQDELWVFGKAITSRMLSRLEISITNLSSPKAIPP